MSFYIFASGSPHFHYKETKKIDGDTFETMKILDALQSVPQIKDKLIDKMNVVEGATGYALPSISITDVAEGIATIELLSLLSEVVDFLAMNPVTSEGWISVSAKKSNTFWADTVSSTRYTYSPGYSPGKEFIRKIAPGLGATDMNNWGVVRAMIEVLSKYQQHINSNEVERAMINIQLSK